MHLEQLVPEDLRQKAEKFVERTGWRGMFMIELLRDRSGKTWFVEFNGMSWEVWRSHAAKGSSIRPAEVALAIDPQSQAGSGAHSEAGIISRNLGRELMHLLFVLRGPKSKALTEWPSFWNSLAGIVRPHRSSTSYNWRWEDWQVFTADVFYTMKSNLFKAKN